jgi:hypothetical protein
MKKLPILLVSLAFLAACSSEPAPLAPLQLDYGSLGKIYLNTKDMRVINRAASAPHKPPYVGYQFRPSLDDAVNRWALDRLQAAGNTGHATVIIKEASVKELPLPALTGVETWFTREQASKYIGRIEADVTAQSPVNNASGYASAHATFAITLPENPTEAEKNIAYRQLLDGLMQDLNQKMEAALRQPMAHFLAWGPSMGAPTQVVPMEPMTDFPGARQ